MRRDIGKEGEEEEVDPRYKNIDMKMVELIKNEIMDQVREGGMIWYPVSRAIP